jgi:hypothetical protein
MSRAALRPVVSQQPLEDSEFCWHTVNGATRKKKKYPTRKASDRAIRSIKRNGTDTNPNRLLNSYQCEHCSAWHVGHSNRVQVLIQ